MTTWPNRLESYRRAYSYGEYKMRNGSVPLTFGIVETVDGSGAPAHAVELFAHTHGRAVRVGAEIVPAWFDEPGTL